jgi:hypothetical protein
MRTYFIILLAATVFLACEQDSLQQVATIEQSPTIESRAPEDGADGCLNQPFGRCSYLDVHITTIDGIQIGEEVIPLTYLVRLINESEQEILGWTLDGEVVTPLPSSSNQNIGFTISEAGTYRLCATFACGDTADFICCENVELE